jgi:hypothetical protein
VLEEAQKRLDLAQSLLDRGEVAQALVDATLAQRLALRARRVADER